ncbi:MAG: hypothetical protein R2692_00205 [Microbacterium sp.]
MPPRRRPHPRAAATAPAATEAIPGLADNVLLQAALAALPDEPQSADIMNVMRQALRGNCTCAQGDAQALIAAGQGLNLAVTTYQDKRFLLVFSGGDPMRQSVAAEAAAAVVDSATSVVGQAAHNVFRTAVDSGYDGVYLDHANVGARLVLPIELVQKALDEGAPVPFELKALLSGRTHRGDRRGGRRGPHPSAGVGRGRQRSVGRDRTRRGAHADRRAPHRGLQPPARGHRDASRQQPAGAHAGAAGRDPGIRTRPHGHRG